MLKTGLPAAIAYELAEDGARMARGVTSNRPEGVSGGGFAAYTLGTLWAMKRLGELRDLPSAMIDGVIDSLQNELKERKATSGQ